MLGSYGFQFDGNFFVCADVGAMVDVAKSTATQFAGQSVFSSDS